MTDLRDTAYSDKLNFLEEEFEKLKNQSLSRAIEVNNAITKTMDVIEKGKFLSNVSDVFLVRLYVARESALNAVETSETEIDTLQVSRLPAIRSSNLKKYTL